MNVGARCGWADTDDLMRAYHDTEWGVPVHDDRKIFEFLILDGAQAGLSWSTILNKRARYREVYDNFDPETVARYDERKVAVLLDDPGIVRNRLKVASSIKNARTFLDVGEEFGTFDNYLWRFVGGHTIMNEWRTMEDVPVTTKESDALSRDLKKRGFSFVGSTIIYAFMQAAGMVNDHVTTCFRHAEIAALSSD